MARPVDEALDAIRSGDPQVAAEGAGLAVSIFEQARSPSPGPAPADLARLRDGLVAVVRAGAPPPVAATAVFALGKAFDPGLRDFFVEVLRTYLEGDAGVLYQAMIALDNLDVPVFAGRRSMSVRAEAENRALAAEFLRQSAPGGRG